MSTLDTLWKGQKILLGAVIAAAVVLLTVYIVALSLKEFKTIGFVGTALVTPAQISIEGKGEVTAVPDIAMFSFTISETDTVVGVAQTLVTRKNDAVLAMLKANGIMDRDVQTTAYFIRPQYTLLPEQPNEIVGYDVSQTNQVKIRDFKHIGQVLTDIGSLNIQNIDSLSFSVDQPESLQDQARAAAIRDAQTKADVLAEQLGVRLLRVVQFSSGSYYVPTASMDRISAMSTISNMVQITAGVQQITSSVTITYEVS